MTFMAAGVAEGHQVAGLGTAVDVATAAEAEAILAAEAAAGVCLQRCLSCVQPMISCFHARESLQHLTLLPAILAPMTHLIGAALCRPGGFWGSGGWEICTRQGGQ